MACYETVLIARQDLSEKQAKDLNDAFSKVLNDNGGNIARTEYWGLRTMAYKINKNRKGHYTMFHIDSDYPAVAEMERQMRLNEDVLRFLTLRIDEIPSENSVMMRSGTSD